MGSTYTVAGRVFHVRSTGVTEHDIHRIWAAMARAHEVHGPLVFFNVMADEAPPQSPELRRALAKFSEDSLAICSHVVVVLEGAGFTQTLKRSFIAGIMLVTGKRGRVFVASSIEDALAKAPHDLRGELAHAAALAERASRPEPPWLNAALR